MKRETAFSKGSGILLKIIALFPYWQLIINSLLKPWLTTVSLFLMILFMKIKMVFMKGRNIDCNIRTSIDLIEYTDVKDIPGSIDLLDIEKAFDTVEHGLLYEVLCRFNLMIILFGGSKPSTVKKLCYQW